MKKLVLVTCLFDLGKRENNPRRQSAKFYLEHGKAVLGLDHDMIVFVDPELVEAVHALDVDLTRKKIVACDFEELPAYALRAKIEEARRVHPLKNPNVSKDTSLYAVFQRAKIQLLRRALDVSEATHFAWIDFGIAKAVPLEGAWRAFEKALALDKVELMVTTRSPTPPSDWQTIRHGVLAGYIPGDRASIVTFCAAYEQEADRVLGEGFAPHDETLLETIAARDADVVSRRYVVDHTRIFSDFVPLLGLVMIVKNEVKRIAHVLASYRSYVDSWTILDTGSTDGTQDVIRSELVDVPGTLHEEPFVDFATSRNRALALHGASTVFTIMPNGDALSGGPELRAFLEAHRNDRAGAYRVRISPGHYYHPLVMRAGSGWRYKGRTHECATGPHVGPSIPGVTVVRDRGSRTDAEWRQRWERDLDLLDQDRIEDPTDPRPYFYLGQTHECLGQHAQALAFFARRSEMGGYFDEVYEAKFRVAKMKDLLDHPWAEVQQAYLEAYAHDPRRAEPLYAISQHWYDEKKHAISRIFAVAAAETPKPPTDLFLDEDVYTWKSADRAAISSFYAGYKDDGRYWAEIALSWRPDDERLRANRAFYAQRAGELFGATIRPIDFVPEQGWNASNPSIYAWGDRLRCVVRTVNYKIVDGKYVTPPDDVIRDDGSWKGWQIIRTRNFLLDLDVDLKTTRVVELVDRTGNTRTSYPVHGFEDARLFAWKGTWWATATVCDFTEDGRREIALLQIAEDGVVTWAEPLRGPWGVHPQKNWMPLVDVESVKFIYATSRNGDVGSTTVLDLIEDGPRYAAQAPAGAVYGHGRLRGGSQGVRVEGGWVFVVHDVAFPGGSERFYLHRFVFFDDQLRLVSMTDPFYFERLGIEFCAGLAQLGDKLVASYAVNDGSSRLGVFDWVRVRRLLRKNFVV